jgi:hypothetical protein
VGWCSCGETWSFSVLLLVALRDIGVEFQPAISVGGGGGSDLLFLIWARCCNELQL